MPIPETEQIKAAQAGDRDAFGALYDAYIERIYHYIFYRVHHRETAEDLTAIAFMKALESLAQFQSTKGTFSAWIYRIARNTLIDHWRTNREMHPLEDIAGSLKSKSSPEKETQIREDLRVLEKELNRLPAETRDLLLLRLWDGLTFAEISDVLGSSEAASKMAFSRGLKKLRKQLPLTAILLLTIIPSVWNQLPKKF